MSARRLRLISGGNFAAAWRIARSLRARRSCPRIAPSSALSSRPAAEASRPSRSRASCAISALARTSSGRPVADVAVVVFLANELALGLESRRRETALLAGQEEAEPA